MPIIVNMIKARAIHLEEIRKVRDYELVKLDVAWMKAIETGDTAAEATITAEKQVLRDIPQTFDLITDSLDVLASRWPPQLPARE